MATNSVFLNLFGSGGGGISPTNPSLFPDGSAAAPSISFINDPQSGRYLIGTDNVGESINGALVFDWNATRLLSTLQIQIPNGTAAAPSLALSGSSTTGLYRIGADNLGFSAGGTLRWDYNTTRILSTIPFYSSEGLVGTPSITFGSDPDTGFWHAMGDLNRIKVSAGGTLVTEFLTSGIRVHGTLELSSAADVVLTRAAASVLTLGPTTGVRLNWTTDGTLRVQNFAGSADGIMRAASYNVGATAGANFGPGVVTSITVVGGIVTAIS